MTSDQIREKNPAEISANTWLKEIALQLAIANEARFPDPSAMPRKPQLRKAS